MLALGIVATPSLSPAPRVSTFAPRSSPDRGFSPDGPEESSAMVGEVRHVPAAEVSLSPVECVDERDLALDLVDVGDRGQFLVVVPLDLRWRRGVGLHADRDRALARQALDDAG